MSDPFAGAGAIGPPMVGLFRAVAHAAGVRQDSMRKLRIPWGVELDDWKRDWAELGRADEAAKGFDILPEQLFKDNLLNYQLSGVVLLQRCESSQCTVCLRMRHSGYRRVQRWSCDGLPGT